MSETPAETIRHAEELFRRAKTPDGYGHKPRWSEADLAVLESFLNVGCDLLAENQRLRKALDGIEKLMTGTYVAQIVRDALAGDEE